MANAPAEQLSLESLFARPRVDAARVEDEGHCRVCDAPTEIDTELCEACEADEDVRAHWREIAERRRARAQIPELYEASRRALRLARAYRAEPGTTGRRERECVEVVRVYRDEIRALRAHLYGATAPALPSERPGLQKARTAPRDLGELIATLGEDVNVRRFADDLWEASVRRHPWSDHRYTARGATPAAALTALHTTLAAEDLRAAEEEERAATQPAAPRAIRAVR